MGDGAWKGVGAALLTIVIGAGLITKYGFGKFSDDGLLMFPTLFVATLFLIGTPAIMGILLVQMPVARWSNFRGHPLGVQLALTLGANLVLTLLVAVIFTGGNVLTSVSSTMFLIMSAIAAALTWFMFDRYFRVAPKSRA
jgi:hypothetical protein